MRTILGGRLRVPRNWDIATVDDIKSPEPNSCRSGPFGSSISSKYFVDDGVPVIRGSNLSDDLNRFVADNFVYVSEQRAREQYSSCIVEAGDLVFTCWGTIGQVGLIPDDGPYDQYVISNKQLKLRVNRERVEPLFLYYLLSSPDGVAYVNSRAKGTAVPGINLGILKAVEVMVPPLQIQRRIIRVLSAYDELIGNNNRRMSLLEESIHLLYREWFVYLRFPGCGRTKIVDGVPKGWSLETLQSVCVEKIGVQTGPFGSQLHQSDYTETGIPVVMPKDIKGNRVVTDGIARIPPSVSERLSKHIVRAGDVLYGRRGDIGRRAYVSGREEGWLCGTGCIRLRPDPVKVVPDFLFEALGTDAALHEVRSRATGATMLNLSANVMKQVPVLIPPKALQMEFSEYSQSVRTLRAQLEEQTQKLREARDLLLPRLMDGRIPV